MMNRRRIGLAALVIGVGAAARQRMKTQADPGPDLSTPETTVASVAEPAESVASDATTPPPAVPADDASVAASLGDPEIDPPGVAPTLGDPEIDPPGVTTSLGDPEIDPPGVAPTLGDPEIDPAVGGSAFGMAEPATPTEPESPDEGSIPEIVLPTMPMAGTLTETTTTPATLTEAAGSAGTASSSKSSSTTAEGVPHTALPLPVTLAESQAAAKGASSAGVVVDPSPAPGIGTPAMPELLKSDVPAGLPGVEAPRGDGPTGKQPFRRAHRTWSIVGSILLGLVVVAVIAAAVVPLPYYSLEPGSVYDTIERVEAPGDLVSIPSGEIGFVTVAQTANITGWQWLDARLDNNVRIRHEDEVRGDQTADELREADIRRMQVSKNAAVVVALRKLGFDLVITPIGIEVAQVFDCTAADGTLGTGDLIVGVNGVEVLSGEALVEQLMDQTIGAEVDLLVERIDPSNPTQSMRTDLVAITLGSADAACLPDDVRAEDPRPFIGIGTLPMFDEEFPIDIDVRTGAVSGPSAGLAFTLAIMDVLSEGELTNGLSVVATGTIDRDGNVGPVGGIHQKTVAAQRSGADVFIVPLCCDNFVDRTTGEPLDIPGNYDEALLYADGDMIIIGVNTIDEALIALGELGGDVDLFLDLEAP